jgi:hypothetical protein
VHSNGQHILILDAIMATLGNNPVVSLAAAPSPVTAAAIAPSTATAGINFTSVGDIERRINASTVDVGDWIVPKSAAGSDYELRATIVAGTLSSGTTGVWQPLNVSCQYTRIAASTIESVVVTFEIRRAADGATCSTIRKLAGLSSPRAGKRSRRNWRVRAAPVEAERAAAVAPVWRATPRSC